MNSESMPCRAIFWNNERRKKNDERSKAGSLALMQAVVDRRALAQVSSQQKMSLSECILQRQKEQIDALS